MIYFESALKTIAVEVRYDVTADSLVHSTDKHLILFYSCAVNNVGLTYERPDYFNDANAQVSYLTLQYFLIKLDHNNL